jgi:hypothetical protein
MNQNTIQIEKLFLHKFAEFTNLVVSELNSLKDQLSDQLQKEASLNRTKENYKQAVIKVAGALYNSDLEFITGDFDQRKFIKLASEDPSYLARTFEKVCNAADVSLIGKPARVAAIKKQAAYDPVYAQAFGFSKNLNEEHLHWED